jgi:hypothetical protein
MTERRGDADLRKRLDEIEQGYIRRADQNHALIDELMARTFWLLAAMVAVFIAAAAVATVNWIRIGDRARENRDTIAQVAALSVRTNGALCALRRDLELRVASSKQFLQEHPEGIAGVPVKVIQDSIRNQQRTILALSNLNCK